MDSADRADLLRDETTAGLNHRAGRIAITAQRIAAPADRNLVDSVDRAALLRDEKTIDLNDHTGWIATIGLRIVIQGGDHSMDRAGRSEDVMNADRDNSTVRITDLNLPVAARNIEATSDSAARKDRSIELPVTDLAERMERAAINTLPVPISIDLPSTVSEARVVRTELAMVGDSVDHAPENTAATWPIMDRVVRGLVNIAVRTILIADMVDRHLVDRME